MRYLPQTEAEIATMLAAIGAPSVDALFDSVPAEARFSGELATPARLAETQLMDHLGELAARNTGSRALSFLGAGAYHHHIPPAVDQLLLRSEFYTAYTPYQPEVAQGTLQTIFEFQTIVSELLGLPLANASMYDGATSVAEGAQMARRLTKRERILVSRCVHPEYIDVIRTYVDGSTTGASVVEVIDVNAEGTYDLAAMVQAMGSDTAACVVGYPSFFGGVADLAPLCRAAHEAGVLVVSSTTDPYALALTSAPGDYDVDIATGEGQPLASPPNYGGPGVGLFACRNDRKYLQQLPGRICGETLDAKGKRGYVLTLSTREQHIRRERATSNICTNQGLLALALTIRASLLGKSGFVEVARQCLAKTHYLLEKVRSLPGCSTPFSAPVFNEFTLRLPGPVERFAQLLETEHVIAGLNLARFYPNLQDCLLIAVTERHTRQDLDRLVGVLSEAVSQKS